MNYPYEIIRVSVTSCVSPRYIRSDLESKGLVIGLMDMLIAAHAMSLSVTLVTNNICEFSRIPKLSLENWTE